MNEEQQQVKVAVVEDDEGLCELIARRLERDGRSCVKLRSAAEALAWFENNDADLMLLDLMLPDSTGEELVDKLQAKGKAIPFIVATGQGSETTAVRLLKQGARDYLVKNSGFLDALTPTVEMVWREVQLEALLAKARERIRFQNATLSAINDFAPDAILAVTAKGAVISFNPPLLTAWGLTEKDMAKGAMHVFSVIASKCSAPDEFMKIVIEMKDDFKGLAMKELRSGEKFYELHSSPIEQGGRVWFWHDFTLHKTAEEGLKKAKANAEELALAKSRFFAVVSHDVKTPLNSISGFVSLLETTELEASQKEYLDVIKASCQHLLVLINDILDFSRMEHGHIELSSEEVLVPDLIDTCLDTFIPAANETGLKLVAELEPGTPERIRGDTLRLRQVLINLIGNAIKFTREGAVTVACRPSPEKPGFLEFQVRDTGMGISLEVQKFLFTPFTQASAEITKRYGGSGLGLAISKQLVERMGGEMRLNSELGKGTVFTFEIPTELKTRKKHHQASEGEDSCQ